MADTLLGPTEVAETESSMGAEHGTAEKLDIARWSERLWVF